MTSRRRLIGPALIAVLLVAAVYLAASGVLAGPGGAAGPGTEGTLVGAGATPAGLASTAAPGRGAVGPGAPATAAGIIGPAIPVDWEAPVRDEATVTIAGIPAHDPAKFGFVAKGMKGEVVAFMTQAEMDYVRTKADLTAISTIAFFGLAADAKGRLAHNKGWRAWNSKEMHEIRDKAHKAGIKFVPSIVRFSWSAGPTRTSRAVLGSTVRRQRLAVEIADAVVSGKADGVNLDFEPIPSGLRDEFTDLTRRVRKELDARKPGLQLTVAITGYFSSYDVKGLAAKGAADAIFLMGYHYAGWWSKRSGSTSPMGGARLDVAETVQKLRKAGVPARKLIVGIPYYGHIWPTASDAAHSKTKGSGRDISVAPALKILARVGRRWDPVEQSTWAAWRENGSWQQLWIDDARTLRSKWRRFQKMGLLGTGMWSIGKEGKPGSINAQLRKSWLQDP